MLRRPSIYNRRDTLLPYPTLVRSFGCLRIYGLAPYAGPALLVCECAQDFLTSLDQPLLFAWGGRKSAILQPTKGDARVTHPLQDKSCLARRRARAALLGKIGDAACRERGCQYG